MFYGLKNVYAVYAAPGPRLDTVGVWGSNPHAPTILFPAVSTNCPHFPSTSFSGFLGICRNSAGIQTEIAFNRRNRLFQDLYCSHQCLPTNMCITGSHA